MTEEIITANANKGYVFVTETSDGLIYKKHDGYETIYFIDEGFPDGALPLWNTVRSKETLEAILKDLNQLK